MIQISRYDADGRYTYTGTVDEVPEELGIYLGAVQIGRQYHNTTTNQPVDMPPRPSVCHDFDYKTKQWVANMGKAWAVARAERNTRLAATDWTQMPDVSASPDWVAYRQALRDITKQGDPFHITWPVAPA